MCTVFFHYSIFSLIVHSLYSCVAVFSLTVVGVVCTSHCVRVSPAMASRMVDAARGVLNQYLPDVYIYTDVVRDKEVGRSVRERERVRRSGEVGYVK